VVSIEAPPIVMPPNPAAGPDPSAEPPVTSPERPAMPAGVMISLFSITALGAIAVFLAVYAVGFSALQEQRSQHQLYASFRGLISPSSPVAPRIGGVIPPGSPVAILNAPEAGLRNTMIVEGTSSSDLLKGPGHLRDSPLPGQVGQSLVLGKSVTADGPFRHLTKLVKGDPIKVTTGQGTFTFVVDGERSGGDPLPALPTGGSLLTLVTSTGSGWLGRFAPSHVIYVDATLQGKAVSAPAGRPLAVPVAELPGRSDPGAWPFLVFWLQGLILAGVGSVWAWLRWGRWQTWLVAAPILLAVLWGISEEAMRLLPNLL
jgi:sortase A